jgi:hypothetical protein
VRPLLLGAAFLLLLLGTAALLPLDLTGAAQAPESTYEISWWTVDGGGITNAMGGGYSLGATAGQPDAGLLAGDGYSLSGGFWRRAAPAEAPSHAIYLPLLLRN